MIYPRDLWGVHGMPRGYPGIPRGYPGIPWGAHGIPMGSLGVLRGHPYDPHGIHRGPMGTPWDPLDPQALDPPAPGAGILQISVAVSLQLCIIFLFNR